MNLPKSVKSYQLMGESSYANSVLQAFIQLQCVQEWIKQLNNSGAINMQYYNTTLTKGIYFLFCNLPSGMLDSSQIIQNFETKSQGIWNKYITKDPYHFLFYFLDILHFENNMPKNPNFNINSYNQSLANNIHSDENTFKLFANYIDQTQNSFISNYFNGIQKYMITCPNCQIMYNYGFKKIFRFNLDEILSFIKLFILLNTVFNTDFCIKMSLGNSDSGHLYDLKVIAVMFAKRLYLQVYALVSIV